MIRLMEEKDAACVAAICRAALGHRDATADKLAKNIARLKNDPEYFICVYTEAVTEKSMGFIQAQRYDLLYGESGWNIIALAVSPECQKRGIGGKLLKALETHAASEGAAFIRLNSRVERTEAHGFYEHLGYTCDKTQKRFIRYLK